MMIMTICSILDALLQKWSVELKHLKEDDLKIAYEAFFLYGAMWGYGGSLGGG